MVSDVLLSNALSKNDVDFLVVSAVTCAVVPVIDVIVLVV